MIEHATGQRLVGMELKYCEGCGGLLLRRSGETVVYCRACQAKLAELPAADERIENRTAAHEGSNCVERVRRAVPVTESADSSVASVPKISPQPAVSTNHAEPRRMA